jgi:hypothetical protein
MKISPLSSIETKRWADKIGVVAWSEEDHNAREQADFVRDLDNITYDLSQLRLRRVTTDIPNVGKKWIIVAISKGAQDDDIRKFHLAMHDYGVEDE